MVQFPNNIKKIIQKKFETLSFTPTGRALQKMGVSAYEFEDLFNEKIEMSIYQADRISRFLGVDIDQLVNRTNSRVNWKKNAENGITKESIRTQILNT